MPYMTREPIEKGWSSDRKFRVTTEDGMPYLLRISDPEKYQSKRVAFDLMREAEALGVPMCRPVAFGMSEEGVYSLQGWIDGEDAESVIPMLPEVEQYAYGLESGRILSLIHQIPAPSNTEPWEARFNRKIDRKLQLYADCSLKYSHGEAFIRHIAENRHLLSGRPQVYQHGDYHIGNMMVDREGRLCIIDFDRSDFGDPWEEFNRIVWSAKAAPAFATGMVNGYFHAETPTDIPGAFWALLALYIASNTLSSLPWAIPFGEGEIATMTKQAEDILAWYDGMRETVPSWYKGNM